MTQQDYLKALKKALSGMDSAARDEVLREIQSHIDESGADGAALVERFGTPEALAEQYLEGETLPTPVVNKAGGIGKTILMVVGGLALLLLALVSIFGYLFMQDDFNYADENATELQSAKLNWQEVPLDPEPVFSVEQARAVFYWHDAKHMRWSCKGERTPIKNDAGEYDLRHKSCLIYVPKHPVTLKGDQADVVLVRPQADVIAEIYQGQLRMAENEASYRYVIDAQRSKVAGFKSDDSASVTIKIKAQESEIGWYEE